MKIALCFSGYPRFVNECFSYIKNNLIDNLSEYDIYGYFQWDEEWENKRIHHEHESLFKKDELEEFFQNYSNLNLKEVKVIEPIKFDTTDYRGLSLESDLIINSQEAKDILYRFKAQYTCISECTKYN
jgi:hypothetical protein